MASSHSALRARRSTNGTEDKQGGRRVAAIPLLLALFGTVLVTVAINAPGVLASGGSQTFTYTGSAQSFTVPSGITSVTIDARGGVGGNSLATGLTGGLAGHTVAVIPVSAGETLQVNVGGRGEDAKPCCQNGSAGGWNGGGGAGNNAAAGGGGSDVRQGGTDLAHRVVVAGGGGGAGGSATIVGFTGGSGGGAVAGAGDDAVRGGSGGSQSGGGAGGGYNGGLGGNGAAGALGQGGGGGGCGQGDAGGGGGGGYYGGGGGGGDCGGAGGGGGGGSSYVEPGATSVAMDQGYSDQSAAVTITWPGGPPASGGPSSGQTTFSATGNSQVWTVPAGVSAIQVDEVGASGAGPGGLGGHEVAVVPVTAGQDLVVDVGISPASGGAGGFNGGGATGGGGASDVRAGGTGLGARATVAAGGGGAGLPGDGGLGGSGGAGGGSTGANGGDGTQGGLPGAAYGTGGGGATQSAGGAAGGFTTNSGPGGLGNDGSPGGLGQGGSGPGGCAGASAGGGGGGYYGGGSGGSGCGGGGGGGGGGSSWTTPNGSELQNTAGQNSGNGTVTITWPASGALRGGPIGAGELRGGCASAEPDLIRVNRAQPINVVTGYQNETVTDLGTPGRGPALHLTRVYNSDLTGQDGPFGFGWSYCYGMSLSAPGGLSGSPPAVTFTEEGGAQVSFNLSGSSYVPFAPRVTASLVHNADGTWRVTRGAREFLDFDAGGNLVDLKDLNGYTTTISHPDGSTTLITDPEGRAYTLSFSGNHVTQLADNAGRTVTYGYDNNGNLTSVVDVGGNESDYGYDASHRLVTMRSARFAGSSLPAPVPDCSASSGPQQVVSTHYDGSGRVDCQYDANGHKTSFDYTSVPGTTIVTDPLGNKVAYQISQGLVSQQINGYGSPQAATWVYTYDPVTAGVTSVTDPNGHVSARTYDAQANVLTATDALGHKTTNTYDSLNDLTSTQDPNGVTTTLAYDARGNLLSSSTPLVGSSPAQSQTTTYTDGDSAHPGDVTTMTDPDGKVWHYGYDPFGDRTSQTDPLGHQSLACFDGVGNRVGVISPLGAAAGTTCASLPAEPAPPAAAITPPAHSVAYAVDGFGQTLRNVDALGQDTQSSYDADHNLASQTDAKGNVTSYDYDNAEQQTIIYRADGTALQSGYDVDGNLASQTDGANQTTSYSHSNPAYPDRVTSVTDPLGRLTAYSYDASGNRLSTTAPATSSCASPCTTTLGYDAANRLTTISYSDSVTHGVTIGYDADSQRTSMVDGSGSSSWTFDSLHRLTQSTNGGGQTVGYGYDLKGQLTSIAYPGGVGSVSRAFDDAGHLSSVTDWANHTTSFSWDPDSELTGQANPNQTTSTYSYDSADQLSGITHTKGGTFAFFSYGRDTNGQVSSVNSSGVPADNHTYWYTPLNQLSYVDRVQNSWSYDPADNLTGLSDGSTVQSFDVANELTGSYDITLVGTASYTNSATTSAALTFSQRPAAVDQILVGVAQLSSAPAPATPSGYALVGSFPSGGTGGGTLYVFRKQAAGTETGVTVTWTIPTATSVVVAIYRGVDPSAPIDAQASGAAPGAQNVSAGPVTTSLPGERLVLLAGEGNALASANTWYGGLGTIETQASSNITGAVVADQTQASPGPSPTATAYWGGGPTNLEAALLALKPRPTVYGHDAQGDRTGMTPALGAASSYGYDQANRLISFSQGSTSASYGYRGDGLRMAKTVGSSTQHFAWDESAGLPLLLSDGTTDYIYGPDGRVVAQYTPQPAITLVGTGKGGDAGISNSAAVSFGATAVANDQILVATTQASANTASVNTPTGYTKVGTYGSSASGAPQTVVFRKQATGGESSVTVTYGTTTTVPFAKSVVVAVYRGVDQFNPIDGTNSASASASSITVGSVTTTLAGDRLVMLTGTAGNALAETFTPQSPLTDRIQESQNLTSADLSDTTVASAGASGSQTTNLSASNAVDGVLIALKPPSGYLYYHQDQLGSTRLLTESAGNVVGTATYDPYGRVVGTSGMVSPLGFAGEYTDAETGLVYMRARYYDPSTAQFLSRDPAVAVTGQPYAYVDDNPLNGTDPSGLWNYNLNYDLGASVMSPEDLMSLVAANFRALFPVPGAKPTLKVGEIMHLRPHYAPFWVRVAEMSSTGWEFDAHFPHVDTPGFISFNFSQTSDCHLHLAVHGNANGLGWLFEIPGLHQYYMMDAKHYWGAFARNLRKEIQVANSLDPVGG